MSKKRVIISVTNDLVTDQRVNRLCCALNSSGFEIILTGRVLPGSLPLTARPYATRRKRHWFNKNFLFYAEYNIRLFMYLLFTPFDILHANDLDTLPANYLASLFKRRPLVYDTHEYFTEVPELAGRPMVKSTWRLIERLIFPDLHHIITVSSSIAEAYKNKYSKMVHVIRNLPERQPVRELLSATDFGLPENIKLIILQGRAINRDRGAEEAIQAMNYIDNAALVIAGSGDMIPELKELAGRIGVIKKVYFIPAMPYEKLMQLTAICDCGLSLDKDTCLNYRYSLPNKLFDYIMAGIPVLASPLPEVRKIVESYNTGLLIENHSPGHIAEKLNTLLYIKPKKEWEEYLAKASEELSWDNEKHKLLEFYEKLR